MLDAWHQLLLIGYQNRNTWHAVVNFDWAIMAREVVTWIQLFEVRHVVIVSVRPIGGMWRYWLWIMWSPTGCKLGILYAWILEFDQCIQSKICTFLYLPNDKNIMIPGSSKNSDLSAPISIVKGRLKNILFDTQRITTPGRVHEWLPDNNWTPSF